MPLIAIWAESQNGIIGNGNQLPWHIPSELKHFKRLTTGHSVVMGYRTALDLKNKTFANRNMILYSNHSVDSSFKNFTVMDFNDILNLAKTEDVFIAGGAATYKDFLPFVDAVIRTVISKDYEGDVLAPDFHITDEMTVERIPVQNEGEPAYVVEYIPLPLRKEITMDIGSGSGYPSSNLSNFSPHGFVVDGVECASMEGFLQSLKVQDPEMQKYVCTLVGKAAKFKGKKKKWWKTQTLYWQGEAIPRDSERYQELLDKAFNALAENSSFRRALLATQNATLTHNMGKKKISETVLTKNEFTSRLTAIRTRLQKEKD
jgi:bacteriophage protein GP30.3